MAYIHSIEVRFRDLDALGHVHNAVQVMLDFETNRPASIPAAARKWLEGQA